MRVLLDNGASFSGGEAIIVPVIRTAIVDYPSIPWDGRAARGWQSLDWLLHQGNATAASRSERYCCTRSAPIFKPRMGEQDAAFAEYLKALFAGDPPDVRSRTKSNSTSTK
jgi:hypothetical protein